MKADFSQPQRQSGVGVLVMFFDTIRHFAKALWPILVVTVLKANRLSMLYVMLIIGGLILIIAIIAYLKYRNFTFHLDSDNDEFVVTDGIFNKTRTTIKLNKIQQVNIKQSLLQKIINVHALDVDTAGSNKQEVAIKAISHELALSLKSRLLESDHKTDFTQEKETSETVVNENQPFVNISLLSLLKVGITANYVKSFLLLLAFFFSMYENFRQLFEGSAIDEDQFNSYVERFSMLEVIPVMLLGLFLIILIMNVGRMVFRYFDFKITRQKGSLLLSYGLLTTKSTILKPEKVQITVISRNYFQKKMNILQMKIRQATSGEKEERKSAIEIPGCNEMERDEILKLIFHKIPQKGLMLKPNWRKLGFALFLTIVLPLAGFYAIRYYSGSENSSIDYLVPIYVVVLCLLQFFKYKNNRLFIHDDFIIKQSGAWDISHEIIEPGKIQAISTSQLFWHKNLNIGSLTLHTAGGNIAFQLGNFDTIKNYANLWLYELETSDSNWM